MSQYGPLRLDIRPLLSGRQAYIADTFAKLITHPEHHIRRGALLAVLGANNEGIIALAAQAASVKIALEVTSIDTLHECALFMQHTRSLGWGEVIEAVKA